MSELPEKIAYNVIGGIFGIALGLLLKSLNLESLKNIQYEYFLTITTLIGILFSVYLLDYKSFKDFKIHKEVRDETVALITHEMRTGLTSTSWAIQVILECYQEALSAEHREMLRKVTKSINTTVMHSVNLLDISLSDIGKLTIALSWIKLAEVETIFKETLEKYAVGATQAGITLTSNIKLNPDLSVEADTLRSRITLENLLENAIQYTLNPEKNIHVDIYNDKSNLHITVQDTGIGIPEAEKVKIFSEFFRASNARRVLGHGSGIGLHMCHEYVQAHHGTIRFESTENKGTSFYITLPLRTKSDVNDFLKKI